MPDILKTALPVNTAAVNENNVSGVVRNTKPIKNDTPVTPARGRTSNALLGIPVFVANDKQEGGTPFVSKGKNAPKPSEEFYKDLLQFQ